MPTTDTAPTGFTDLARAIHFRFTPGDVQGGLMTTARRLGKQMYFRKWAEQHHNIADTVKESVDVYRRFL